MPKLMDLAPHFLLAASAFHLVLGYYSYATLSDVKALALAPALWTAGCVFLVGALVLHAIQDGRGLEGAQEIGAGRAVGME